MTYELTAPLPTDRDECLAVLDAACMALWGGTAWVPRKTRRRKQMPPSWVASMLSGHDGRE